MVREYSFPITSRVSLIRACSITTALLGGLLLPAHSQEVAPGKPQAIQSPVKYGPFDVLYGIRGGLMYDDNIFISHTNKQSDVIWTITPNIMVGAGDYREQEGNLLTLNY